MKLRLTASAGWYAIDLDVRVGQQVEQPLWKEKTTTFAALAGRQPPTTIDTIAFVSVVQQDDQPYHGQNIRRRKRQRRLLVPASIANASAY